MNGTLKQQVYTFITGICKDICGDHYGRLTAYYSKASKKEKIEFVLMMANELNIRLSELDARQICNAIENKRKYIYLSACYEILSF